MFKSISFSFDKIKLYFNINYIKLMSGILENTLIPLTNGKQIPVQNIKKGDKIYTLSKTGEVIEGNVIECSIIKKAAELYKIEFYNTSYIVISPEQELITLEGKAKKANKLKISDKIMPFLLEDKSNKQKMFESRSYFIIKQIKRITERNLYNIQTNQHSLAVITTMEKGDKPNEFGGCFAGK